jgi:hypothetical protein
MPPASYKAAFRQRLSMVPKALKTWFIIHFWADIAFALPLLIAPVWFLKLFGWAAPDPIASRMVGAALVGIGVESLLGRNAAAESFRTMLRLKVFWSSTAALGILVSMLEVGAPWGGWLFFGVFAGFFGVWFYWKQRMDSLLG